jgi:PKD repeat protein
VVEYSFQHIKNADDIITLKEFISVLWVKKEAILDLKLEYDTNYAPVVVRFDASKSFIKNDDIIKFIYDYGNWVVEERDSINPWHRYKEAGDYTIKLTVVGKTGKSYSIEKKLILLPAAQEISISPSLKRAPIFQWIDFSSAESAGQIVEYFWDFWDGNISTMANPTHSYKKPWVYEVKLRADFANSNIKEDIVEIEIYEP